MSARRILALLALCALPCAARAHGEAPAMDAPALLAAVALAAWAVLYVRAYHVGQALRPLHALAFAGGWLALAAAIAPPLERAAAGSFAWHMVQHELLMVAAPPLLILARPFAALSASLPPRILRVFAWPLRIPTPAAWLLHAAALWTWHVPTLFDAARGAPWTHAAQHASFFFTALLFWWTVLRRVRAGTAALYVLTTIIHSGALAALLTFAPASLYAGATLADQQLGGLIMWVPAGYALLLAGLVACNRLIEAHA